MDMARDPNPVNAPHIGASQPACSGRRFRGLALGRAVALAFALGGCALFEAPTVPRGNHVDQEALGQITPGVQTRQDVQALLGSPSARSTFGDDRWYYISSTTRVRPGRFLQVQDQRVVAVAFDDQGIVREVREVTEADARPVKMVSRETPVPGNDRSVLQQIFGNIGRVGPVSGGSGGTPGRL